MLTIVALMPIVLMLASVSHVHVNMAMLAMACLVPTLMNVQPTLTTVTIMQAVQIWSALTGLFLFIT